MEQFIRTELLLGSRAMDILAKSKVLVIGCGGVGSQAISLARVGIGQIDLVDSDIVSISNINRQIIANFNTVGRFKVDVMKEQIQSINPKCKVNTFKTFILPQAFGDVDVSMYDYVIDAIDTVSAKLAIIEECQKFNVPIISSMGTGNKVNPTLLQIADIYDTTVCPLAKVMRARLKKRGIERLKVCFSPEEPKKVVADSDGTRHSPASMAFVPAVAGLLICNEVVKDILIKNGIVL